MSISVQIQKRYPGFSLDVAFQSEDNRIGILGASGCGKSMTLRSIAGIETPDSGRIVINGKTVFDSDANIDILPRLRNTGFLFQHYALFPTMTVEENIRIVADAVIRRKARKSSSVRRKKQEVEHIVHSHIKRLQLSGLEQRKPMQLSGGQQQRVALARILVADPEILLLDEPFSALDTHLRSEVEEELQQILDDWGGTVLFVSHNRDEVFRISQQTLVMDKGRIVGQGSTQSMFEKPDTVAAARLTGCKNIAKIETSASHTVFVPDWGISLQLAGAIPKEMTHIGIRAHHISECVSGHPENRIEFDVDRDQRSAFTVSERLRAVPKDGLPAAKKTLLRLVEGSHQHKDARVLQILPEHILLLRESMPN